MTIEEFRIVNWDTMQDITTAVRTFRLVETKKIPLTVTIEFVTGDKMKLGVAKSIQRKSRFRIKMKDEHGNTFDRFMDEK